MSLTRTGFSTVTTPAVPSICPSRSVRDRAKQVEIDSGRRPGTTTNEAAEIKALRHEVKELKRANEILLAASSFFAAELDPRLPW